MTTEELKTLMEGMKRHYEEMEKIYSEGRDYQWANDYKQRVNVLDMLIWSMEDEKLFNSYMELYVGRSLNENK